jgi:hypothetical protein
MTVESRLGSLLLALAALGMALDAGAVPAKKGSKAASNDTEPPAIEHARIEHAPLGQAIVVKAKITDQSEIFAPSVQFRPKGSKEYDAIEMRKTASGYEATIPAEQVNTDIEYFIEAFDANGNGPARAGSPEEPIRVSVFDAAHPPPSRAARPREKIEEVAEPAPLPAEDQESVLSKWWFWTVVVAAAGGGVAAYLALRPGNVSAVDVQVHGPAPGAM